MFNKVIMAGNLAADPELRYTAGGTAVANLRLAVNSSYKSGDEFKEEVLFISVTVWGKQGESCSQYLSKGRQVLVEGRLKPDPQSGGPRVWTGQDGTVRASFEITANTVRFIGSREDAAPFDGEPAEAPAAQEEDEIPF